MPRIGNDESAFPFMTSETKKPFVSPALQAKLLLMHVTFKGLVQDFWNDGPLDCPLWLTAPVEKLKGWMALRAKTAAAAQAAKKSAAAASRSSSLRSSSEAGEQRTDSEATGSVKTRDWVADRVQVMEAMWGEGHSLPGGDEYIVKLSSPLGIQSEMSVLDMSAALGALARKLVDDHKTYVTGLEADPILAARGMVMSIAAGKSKTASIGCYDPVTYSASRKYDCIFARELFYRIIGKEKFFKAVDSSLKTGGGQIVFTDYILDPSVREKPAIVHWLARERDAAPLTAIETIKLWKGMGYDLRVSEDQTEEYKAMISVGLKNLASHMMLNVPDAETKRTIVREVDLWARRAIAFGHGLKYYRFYGIKY